MGAIRNSAMPANDKYTLAAVGGETVINLGFDAISIIVFRSGIQMTGGFTKTGANEITLNTPLTAGEDLAVIKLIQ